MTGPTPGGLATVVVIAKQPVPGRVKTRLCPPLTHVEAAALARAAIEDTLGVVEAFAAVPPVQAAQPVQAVLAFEGDERGWLRPGWAHRPQCDGTLDHRLAAAIGASDGPTLLVGMDTPQISPELLASFDPSRYDACLGPTVDGGYWGIGLGEPRLAADVIVGVPMSTTRTFAAQLIRLRATGLRVQILERLVDVDTIADAHLVADEAPHTRFAAAVRRLGTIAEVA